MINEEIKTLLYNIFGINFPDSLIIDNNFVAFLPQNKTISVYVNTDDYNSIHLDIYTTENFYDETLSILNNQRIYGFIKNIDNVHCCISFISYNNLKNIDI